MKKKKKKMVVLIAKIYKFFNQSAMVVDIFGLTYDTLFRNARSTPVHKQLLQYFKVLDSKR